MCVRLEMKFIDYSHDGHYDTIPPKVIQLNKNQTFCCKLNQMDFHSPVLSIGQKSQSDRRTLFWYFFQDFSTLIWIPNSVQTTVIYSLHNSEVLKIPFSGKKTNFMKIHLLEQSGWEIWFQQLKKLAMSRLIRGDFWPVTLTEYFSHSCEMKF